MSQGEITSPGDQFAAYERDGYVVFRNVLDFDLIAEMNGHIDWCAARLPDMRPEHLVIYDAFLARVVSDPRLLAIAERFIGPDFGLFSAHYLVKMPITGLPVLWHQDVDYWPIEPKVAASLWVAIDHATATNGCMQVIPGTHRQARLRPHRKTDAKPNTFDREIELAPEESACAVDLIMAPGDVSIHHGAIIHGSAPNRSMQRRAGMTIHYIPASTTITELTDFWGRQRTWVWLLRGQDRGAGHRWMPLPKYQVDGDYPFRGCDGWA